MHQETKENDRQRVCSCLHPCGAFSNAPTSRFQANGLNYCPIFRAFAVHFCDAMTARIYGARNHAGEIESEHAACCRTRKYFRCKLISPPLSLEGVSQMDSILPERLLALVRPGNDLVLRRIRSLKRCVQACGCKIMTPRYAPQFGSRLQFNRANLCRAKKKTKTKKKTRGPKKRGPRKKGKGVSFGKA